MSNEKKSTTRLVSKAAAPIKPVSGGWAPSKPKDIQPSVDLPFYYPNSLKIQTQIAIQGALKKFPKQPQILCFCKEVIRLLKPKFRAAIQVGEWSNDLAVSAMQGICKSLFISNSRDSSQWMSLEGELLKSREWGSFLRGLSQVVKGRASEKAEGAKPDSATEPRASSKPKRVPERIGDLEKLRKLNTLTHQQAAAELGCGARNIGHLVKAGKLTKTSRGRIMVDSKFVNEYSSRQLQAKRC